MLAAPGLGGRGLVELAARRGLMAPSRETIGDALAVLGSSESQVRHRGVAFEELADALGRVVGLGGDQDALTGGHRVDGCRRDRVGLARSRRPGHDADGLGSAPLQRLTLTGIDRQRRLERLVRVVGGRRVIPGLVALVCVEAVDPGKGRTFDVLGGPPADATGDGGGRMPTGAVHGRTDAEIQHVVLVARTPCDGRRMLERAATPVDHLGQLRHAQRPARCERGGRVVAQVALEQPILIRRLHGCGEERMDLGVRAPCGSELAVARRLVKPDHTRHRRQQHRLWSTLGVAAPAAEPEPSDPQRLLVGIEPVDRARAVPDPRLVRREPGRTCSRGLRIPQ